MPTRKMTRRLRTFKETIDGVPTAKMGRSADHPEDAIKVLMFDPEEADRPYVLVMPVSEAQRFGAALIRLAEGR